MASQTLDTKRSETELLVSAAIACERSGVRSIDDLASKLAQRILEIERHLELLLRQVFQHPKFRRLESSFRNLKRLVDTTYRENRDANQSTPKSRRANLFVLDISADELRTDLRASSVRQSDMYEKLYFKRFDLLVGVAESGESGIYPFSLMLVDFDLTYGETDEVGQLDLNTVEKLSQIGEVCFCMILLSASPALLGIKSFSDLPDVHDLGSVFESQKYLHWNLFREQESSRMVGVCLPRVLVREPYQRHFMARFGFTFSETSREGSEHLLWGNAALALAQVFVRSFIVYDWFSDVCGLERPEVEAQRSGNRRDAGYLIPESLGRGGERFYGGIIDCLPTVEFSTESAGAAQVPAVECVLSEFDEAVLSSRGLIGIYSCPRTALAAVLSCQSLQATRRMTSTEATNNIRLSTMFNYMLCACRMAHRMKLECRSRIGGTQDARTMEADLQNWLIQFASQRSSSFNQKKEKPFCSPGTGITVIEDELDPGKYQCEVSLSPHHKYDSSRSRLTLEPILLHLDVQSEK